MPLAWNVGGRARARAVGHNLATDALSTTRLAQARGKNSEKGRIQALVG